MMKNTKRYVSAEVMFNGPHRWARALEFIFFVNQRKFYEYTTDLTPARLQVYEADIVSRNWRVKPAHISYDITRDRHPPENNHELVQRMRDTIGNRLSFDIPSVVLAGKYSVPQVHSTLHTMYGLEEVSMWERSLDPEVEVWYFT
jgi:hypothetical protein